MVFFGGDVVAVLWKARIRLHTDCGVGIFKLGLKKKVGCKGYEKASEVTASDIECIKVMFTPDALLSARLEKP